MTGNMDRPESSQQREKVHYGRHIGLEGNIGPSRYREGLWIHWRNREWAHPFGGQDQCLVISFPLHEKMSRKNAIEFVTDVLWDSEITWLGASFGIWAVDLDELRQSMPIIGQYPWLKGIVAVPPSIIHETRPGGKRETVVRFVVSKEIVKMSMPPKVFLSHKGVDKPLVREFFDTLKELGFDPWLDENAMVAGIELERGLLDGMQDSCAAIFFVTPDFQDESFISTEINYAIMQKREKGKQFSIITLVLQDELGRKGKVPELLRQYVWKEPHNHLEALREIVRAMPLRVLRIVWKS